MAGRWDRLRPTEGPETLTSRGPLAPGSEWTRLTVESVWCAAEWAGAFRKGLPGRIPADAGAWGQAAAIVTEGAGSPVIDGGAQGLARGAC